MSYDIRLVEPVSRKVAQLDTKHHIRGGTYRMGGTEDLELNITYNYGKHYYRVLGEKGIRTIYGMTALDSIPILESAANQLGNNTSNDYWEATEGNAKTALIQLITLAKMRPDCIWDGD